MRFVRRLAWRTTSFGLVQSAMVFAGAYWLSRDLIAAAAFALAFASLEALAFFFHELAWAPRRLAKHTGV
jgi:uncharacterized membrane protein